MLVASKRPMALGVAALWASSRKTVALGVVGLWASSRKTVALRSIGVEPTPALAAEGAFADQLLDPRGHLLSERLPDRPRHVEAHQVEQRKRAHWVAGA